MALPMAKQNVKKIRAVGDRISPYLQGVSEKRMNKYLGRHSRMLSAGIQVFFKSLAPPPARE
jgi:hypothetical protein